MWTFISPIKRKIESEMGVRFFAGGNQGESMEGEKEKEGMRQHMRKELRNAESPWLPPANKKGFYGVGTLRGWDVRAEQPRSQAVAKRLCSTVK